MADNTAIEWADATWNPIIGCSIVSPGCTNCYAMRLAGTRMQHHWSRKGLTQPTKAGPVWTGDVRFNEDWLDQPLRWKKPRRIFVCAHGDLFAEGVPDAWIDLVFAVMALCPQHTFLVLTKRAQRMRDYLTSSATPHCDRNDDIAGAALALREDWVRPDGLYRLTEEQCFIQPERWPLPNCWAGVSVEDQARADERIPLLLDTPAAKRFISAEPLLGAVDINRYLRRMIVRPNEELTDRMVEAGWSHPGGQGDHPGLDWVIVGGESGPGARPMEIWWAYSLIEQCRSPGVACFVKQMGGNAISTGAAGADPDGTYRYRYRDRKGGDWSEWMPELRIREFPQGSETL